MSHTQTHLLAYVTNRGVEPEARVKEGNKEGASEAKVTNRGDEQVSDGLAVIPLSHAGRQGDLEHEVALMDLLQTIKDFPHLLGL